MRFPRFSIRVLAAAMATSAIALSVPAQAQSQAEPVNVKFTLDWRFQSVHGWFLHALERGYFRQEGLNVTIDSGEGSAATITRVASGAYDAGFGDMSALVQLASTKPEVAPVMVYMIYNRAPFILVSRKEQNIRSPKDLEGKSIVSTAGSAALRIFPAFARSTGVAETNVKWVNVAPNLLETALVKGEAEVAAGFINTMKINLRGMKLDTDKDFNIMFMADHGVDVYSNGVMVSRELATKRPEAVRGLVRAINRSFHEIAANPTLAIDAALKRDGLLSRDVERDRYNITMQHLVNTPEVREIGVGDMRSDRLARSLKQVGDSFQLARVPTEAEVFNRSFLPPRAERMLKQ
jgi:NitT/TauT family transport system substrate-binding protein